jgi:cell division protein FtsW (lipid II flippase)
MCVASGGLWGLGIGKGKMKYLFAADSDMVFATVSEEWGMIMMILAVLCVVTLALFAVRSARFGRSIFFVIGSCTAAGILLAQTIFNVLAYRHFILPKSNSRSKKRHISVRNI